jgi:lipoprotein-releasing system permease protein
VLALQLAWKFLREGLAQSLLVLAGVAVGVAAYVFITATMAGVQSNLLEQTLGAQAHLTVLDEPPEPQPLYVPADGRRVLRHVVSAEPRQRPFDQWQRALDRTEATPGVLATAPVLTGSALALRGGAQEAVVIRGADPARLRSIIDLPGNLVDGDYNPGIDRAVIGVGLAEALDVRVGSPLRVRTDAGESRLRVVGVFELGSEAVDGRWLVVSLRGAQTLLGRPGDISAIEATVDDLFTADVVAAEVAARTGLTVESWIDRNAALLSALSAQAQSTRLIQLFALLAVAMGIASVLAVTVVQRRGQIGILRAMGVRAGVVLQVFLWQGAMLGIGGAALGTVLGGLAGAGLQRVVPFPILVDAQMAAVATAISLITGLLAAAWPARTAANMDPAAAIRGDG